MTGPTVRQLEPGVVFARAAAFRGVEDRLLFDLQHRRRDVTSARRLAVIIFRLDERTYEWIAERLGAPHHSMPRWLVTSASQLDIETAKVLYQELKEER